MNKVFIAICASVMIGAAAAPSYSGTAEPIILTVNGKTADGIPVEFTRPQLEALGRSNLRHHNAMAHRVGILRRSSMRRLIDKVGARGDKIVVVALTNIRPKTPSRF